MCVATLTREFLNVTGALALCAAADPTCESVYKYDAGTFRLRRSCCSEAIPFAWCKHCEVYYADKCSLGPCNTGQGGTTYFKPGCDSPPHSIRHRINA